MDFDLWAEWYDVYYSTVPEVETSFYVDLAVDSGGPVLEVGVGTGRIAIPTASAGVNVTGLDLNQAMLERAGAFHESVTLFCGGAAPRFCGAGGYFPTTSVTLISTVTDDVPFSFPSRASTVSV